MNLRTTYIIVASALALVIAGCASNGCLDNRNSIPLAGFYSAESGDPVSVSGLTVGGVGAKNDSLLLNKETATEVYLPFRASFDEVTYLFTVSTQTDTLTDEVTFTYDASPYFVDAECGAMYRYRITGVWFGGTLIDSIAITDSLITNVDQERIKIYFHGSAG